jgi:stage II sporulation protein AA (anti-sigma F factor antagonist)
VSNIAGGVPPPDAPEPNPQRTDALGIRAPAAFRIEHPPSRDGVSLIVLRGEVDLAAAATLRAHVRTASDAGLVIDLAAVTFIDSSALRELLFARDHLAGQDARLVLAAVPPGVHRLLRLTGTLAMFEVAASRTEALARFG